MIDNFKCAYTDLVELNKLVPNPKNPNVHPVAQIELLAKIIDFQGQRAPVVVSKRSGFITKGHGRLLAILRLGWTKAAIDYQDYESEAQEYADMVADNAIAELSIQNREMIKDFIISTDFDIDVDLDLLGIPSFKSFLDSDIKSLEVNKGDENSEWVGGMPDFESGSEYVKLIYHFKTELEREMYVKEKGVTVDKKISNQWIIYL